MEQVTEFLRSATAAVVSYFQTGFNTVNNPNVVWLALGLAVIAVVLMGRWAQLLIVSAATALVYVLAEHFWGIAQGAPFQMPPVTEPNFWVRLGVVFGGMLIMIAMLFAVKKVFFMRGGAAEAKKKH